MLPLKRQIVVVYLTQRLGLTKNSRENGDGHRATRRLLVDCDPRQADSEPVPYFTQSPYFNALLDRSPALNELEQYHHDRHDQQDVNESTHRG